MAVSHSQVRGIIAGPDIRTRNAIASQPDAPRLCSPRLKTAGLIGLSCEFEFLTCKLAELRNRESTRCERHLDKIIRITELGAVTTEQDRQLGTKICCCPEKSDVRARLGRIQLQSYILTQELTGKSLEQCGPYRPNPEQQQRSLLDEHPAQYTWRHS
jgi:hypothetical protein